MYDLIIIGGGIGGCDAAIRAREMGKKVLLIEAQKIGGACLHRGCIPTKTYLKYAHLFHACRDAEFFTGRDNLAFDFAALIAAREKIISQLAAGLAQALKKNQIEIIAASAEIAAVGKVRAGANIYETAHILIASGSEPARPPIPGIELADTSDSFLAMTALPQAVAIIGGGVIGLEIAAFFRALKIPATIIEMTAQIAGTLDREIAHRLRQALKKNGTEIYIESRVVKIEAGAVYFTGSDGETQKIAAEKIIAATGRTPRVAGLGLENAGVEFNSRGVKTNPRGQTSVAGIWAAGDVTGRCLLAHAAAREAVIAVENMFGDPQDARAMRYDAMPSVIYTDPEIASVGMNEEQLQAANIAYQKISTPLAVAGRCAIEFPGQNGLIKILFNPQDRQIFGAQIFGGAGGEMIHTLAMMITWKIPADKIREVIFPHPTVAEAIFTALSRI